MGVNMTRRGLGFRVLAFRVLILGSCYGDMIVKASLSYGVGGNPNPLATLFWGFLSSPKLLPLRFSLS